VAPRLVKATIDAEGQLKETNAAATRPVLKPEVATTMTSIMKDVVCSGTATLAQVKGMTVAGKTGTGYKAQDNGTYTTATGGRKYFASFVGYFPADDPKITMLVSIDEPDGSSRDRFGGTAAAPVFSRLANVAIQELDITPTGVGTGCPADAKSGH
jgi:cell division protein FtsI (penicillin-binding protein 3)